MTEDRTPESGAGGGAGGGAGIGELEFDAPRRRRERWFARYVKYPLEAALFFTLLKLLRLLPLESASRFGAWFAGTFGPRVGAAERALRNLRLVYPDMPEEQRRKIAKEMWRELGATAAEYAHLDRILDPAAQRIELVGTQGLIDSHNGGEPVIVASGHFSNFEVMHMRLAQELGDVTTIVREPNNKFIEAKLEELRAITGGNRIYKGRTSAKALVAALTAGNSMGIMVDQKLTNGIEADFLGYPALTSTAAAALAVRLKRPIYTAHLLRTGPGRFRLLVEGPIRPKPDSPRNEEIRRITQQLNDKIGAYVLEHPSSWFWLHRRWPKSVYQHAGV